MLMNEIKKTELFGILSDNSRSITNHEIKFAYENFVKEIITLNQTESDYVIVFRSLKLTRIEFQSLQTQILYEQGKKCPEKSLFAESYFCY